MLMDWTGLVLIAAGMAVAFMAGYMRGEGKMIDILAEFVNKEEREEEEE